MFAKESNKGISSIQHKPMPKRILGSGKAAMEVSALAFGCMGLNYHRSKKLSKKEAQNIRLKASPSTVRIAPRLCVLKV